MTEVQKKPNQNNLWKDAWIALQANVSTKIALFIMLTICLLVAMAPLLSPYQFDVPDWENISSAPSFVNGHFFGTDDVGRDLLARTLYGGRISLMVGIAATLVSLLIGITWGATAGYVGGRTDQWMMRLVDVLYGLPFMFFVILLMVFFGRNILLIFVAIGTINWLDMARIVRGQTLSIKKKEFVQAAKVTGVTNFNIVRRHIIPNLLGVVIVYVTLTIPQVILVESFLSFLGLGVQEPMTSWGALVNDGAQSMETAPWALIFPGVFLALTLFCFNFIGDGLRDALDPRDRNK
ncbi:MAG: ABC transporter permease subunit [Pseudomonadota bacterium]|nr:ABC transporter permease subunit [Pseudomonadota bacterium]